VMKSLKIGIASPEKMKERTLRIARGELKPSPNDPKVWVKSFDSLARMLSNKNLMLLEIIASSPPQTLSELAERTGRAVSNLSRTLHSMERYGLVEMKRTGRRVSPQVKYASVTFDVPVIFNLQ
jgi:predicted transcriptional regulator